MHSSTYNFHFSPFSKPNAREPSSHSRNAGFACLLHRLILFACSSFPFFCVVMLRLPFRPPLVFIGPSLSRSSSSVKALSANRQRLNFRELKHPTKVPQKPHVSDLEKETIQTSRISVDEQTVQLLERLSLVDLDSREAHKTLEDSIEFASRILTIDTEGVEPLYTVLEQQKLTVREDVITDGNILEDVLANARITEEEYFVAPPGNIPLEQDAGTRREE